MVLFGLDISHHQDVRLDLARAAREGVSFLIVKATEGASWNDPEFAGNLAEARAAGLLAAAYHYQRPDSTAAQVANIRDSVPLDVPVILDVEAGSGTITLTRDLIARLRAAGYRVPLLYLPRWYWQQIGSPSLAGLPPLWSSRYPDNVVGSIADEWADVPAHYWNGYGGLEVAVLQFTSSAAIAGHHPIDANAYRGTRQQLAALLGGSQEDDMSWTEKIVMDPPGTDGPYEYEARAMLAYAWYYVNKLMQTVPPALATLAGQVTALTELVLQLKDDEDLDLDAVQAAAKAGTAEALAEGTVDVDLDIKVGGNPVEGTTP